MEYQIVYGMNMKDQNEIRCIIHSLHRFLDDTSENIFEIDLNVTSEMLNIIDAYIKKYIGYQILDKEFFDCETMNGDVEKCIRYRKI
jgi:hypothetical protein